MHRLMMAPLCILSAASASAQDIPQVLSCTGPIAKSATHRSLVKTFGAGAVSVGEIALGEGETETGTLLFASDPKRRLEVRWRDQKKRTGLHAITVRVLDNVVSTPESHEWRVAGPGTTARLHLGQPLAEVEAMNGRPFKLTGFEWDYSGTATSWSGGRLAKLPGGCNLLVRFEPAPNLPEKVQNDVAGDKEFASNAAKMRAAKPVIYEIGLYWD